MRKYTLDETFFDVLDAPEKWYVLGLLATDGCVFQRPPGPIVTIGLQSKDAPLLEQVMALFGSNKPIRHERRITNKTSGKWSYRSILTVYSARIVNRLIELGITPKKSKTVQFMEGTDELLRHYVRGCLDGDGHYHNSKQVPIVNLYGNKFMCDGFAEFVKRTIGGNVYLYKHGNIFRASLSHIDHVQSLIRLIYKDATIYMARKKIVTDAMLLRERKIKQFPDVTDEMLLEARYRLGGWSQAGREFGMGYSTVGMRVAKRNLNERLKEYRLHQTSPAGKECRFDITDQMLIDLHKELGKWPAVAQRLGVTLKMVHHRAFRPGFGVTAKRSAGRPKRLP